MTIQLTQTTEAEIAQAHRTAARGITDLAGSVPVGLDGGEGSGDLLAIIAAVVSTADDIALLNEVAAGQVEEVGRGMGTTDDDVADNFRKMDVAGA